MPRYVALLRGIAPNGHNMQNAKLRGVVAGLGFEYVGSVISSGNITFTSPSTDVAAIQQEIEDALLAELEVSSRTIVRPHRPLRDLLDADPFDGQTHAAATYLMATFVRAPLPAGLPDTAKARARIVGYDAGAGAVLAELDNTDTANASAHMAWLERAFGKDITTRTWLTVQRIVAKLEAEG